MEGSVTKRRTPPIIRQWLLVEVRFDRIVVNLWDRQVEVRWER